MSKGLKTTLIIIGVAVVLFFVYCYINILNIYNSSTWDVHRDNEYQTYETYGGYQDIYSNSYIDSYADSYENVTEYYAPAVTKAYTSAPWKDEYAAVAMKPELSSCFELYAERTINFSITRIAVESYKYKSLDDLCAALPAEWSSEIRRTLERGDSFVSYDLNDVYVTAYGLDSLPLASINEIDSAHRSFAERVTAKHYVICEYDDGSYRFLFWFEY